MDKNWENTFGSVRDDDKDSRPPCAICNGYGGNGTPCKACYGTGLSFTLEELARYDPSESDLIITNGPQ